MTLVLDDETVRSVFDWAPAIEALREAYAAGPDETGFPARTMARGAEGWLRTLSGVPAGQDLMGLKVIAAAPTVGRVSYLITLFDQHSAELVAVLDGHSITGYRTAASSALAADLLTGAGPLRVAVIGSGFEARNHVRALAALRRLETVHVYSPSTARAEPGSSASWPTCRCRSPPRSPRRLRSRRPPWSSAPRGPATRARRCGVTGSARASRWSPSVRPFRSSARSTPRS